MAGRWAAVRMLGPRGYGPPYFLDRKWNRLLPHAGEEWWRSPGGIWCPIIAGGAGFLGSMQRPAEILGPDIVTGAGAQSTVALSSNYVAGTGGSAIASRIQLGPTLTLNNLYFFITGYTGTAANVTTINWEVRTGTTTGPDTTAPGLVASGTIDPASATGWINISGISQSLTGGTLYYLIIGDADGNGTDFATVLRSHSAGPSARTESYGNCNSVTTSNGFIATTNDLATGMVLATFSNGQTLGWPFSATATHAASTNRAGFYLGGGLTEQLSVFGLMSNVGDNLSGVEIYDGTELPGGTTLASGTTFVYAGANKFGVRMATAYVLAKATTYRIVFTYSSNSAGGPRELQLGTGNDANVKAAMFGAGAWYYALANGTTDWTNDVATSFPYAALLVEDQVAITSGGSGGGTRGFSRGMIR